MADSYVSKLSRVSLHWFFDYIWSRSLWVRLRGVLYWTRNSKIFFPSPFRLLRMINFAAKSLQKWRQKGKASTFTLVFDNYSKPKIQWTAKEEENDFWKNVLQDFVTLTLISDGIVGSPDLSPIAITSPHTCMLTGKKIMLKKISMKFCWKKMLKIPLYKENAAAERGGPLGLRNCGCAKPRGSSSPVKQNSAIQTCNIIQNRFQPCCRHSEFRANFPQQFRANFLWVFW